MKSWAVLATVATGGAVGLAARDVLQREHSLKRNFPLLANARYFLETIGPELRQYIITSNDEERPFSRDQRSWVYASSKQQNNYQGFGTDNDIENLKSYVIIKHHTFADVAPSSSRAHGANGHDGDVVRIPAGKVMGAARGRAKPFRPGSVVNISGMSFGSLSGPAIRALNSGALLAECYQNTGEGALSEHHRQGGEIMFQIGTSYFGCRDEQGRFDLDRLVAVVQSAKVRAIEIKLSQGAKPGLGGMLPAAKISEEISRVRGIPTGQDCASPSRHTEFGCVDSLLDFVEKIADATGVPVGIKSAVGEQAFWDELAEEMAKGERGVDFITIDGGEGGTGAAPAVFSDSVALPFRLGFSRVYATFARRGLVDDITWIGSGKLGLPDNALVAFALGCDIIHVAREAMFALGCIQAQKCHTDTCPTGVATQHPWLVRGLDPESKSVRVANYINTLRRDLLKVSEACGVAHPSLLDADDIELIDSGRTATLLRDAFDYEEGWGSPGHEVRDQITTMMRGVIDGDELVGAATRPMTSP